MRRLILLLLLPAAAFAAENARELSFDDGWKFHRGDASGAESAGFDDGAWREVDLPHDWSIEDLPPRAQDDVPVLAIRDGEWLFHEGDAAGWSAAELKDSDWKKVELPAKWRNGEKGFGWYRRHLNFAAADGKDRLLDLGTVMGADEIFFNGERVSSDGSFPPGFDAFWSNVYQLQRTIWISAKLIQGGDNVIAIRLYSPVPGVGGMYDALAPGRREGPFDPGASPNATSAGGTVGGTGWYRKHFILPATDSSRRSFLRFDGAYMNSDVWLNGRLLGNHPYGYTPFEYELTPFLKPSGGDNVISVRLRNEGRNSRWYSGSGLYRHVWLTTTGPARIAPWGISVTTRKDGGGALVDVSAAVEGSSAGFTARVVLFAPDGSIAAAGEASSSGTSVLQTLRVEKPALWSPASPNLYRAQVEALSGGEFADQAETTFGIRTVEIDAARGLRLNGEPLKLKGGCLHHDNGALGAAAIDRAEERRVELLKAAGYDAVRTSHNPPSPAFLDACDRLGMLVIDESFDQWNQEKNPDDYHRYFKDWWRKDVASMVLRDRNHPSVILWSVGNEIPERKTAEGAATARLLADEVRRLDPTRAVTSAFNEVDDESDAYFSAMDVAGYNYNPNRYELDHRRDPKRVIVGTESLPARAYEYWTAVETMPWVIGDFVWTAFDYIGESGLGHANRDDELQAYLKPWPWHLSDSGDLDICGFKKAPSYYRDVVWGRSRLEMAVHRPLPKGRREVVGQWGWPDEAHHWTWPGQEGKSLQVKVYSRYPRVRLYLNGKAIGTKAVSKATKFNGRFEVPALAPETALTATFNVPYEPGELRAVGLEGGQEAAALSFRTAGKPVRLRLTADRGEIRAARDDLSYVTVETLDADGAVVPDAAASVDFGVDGPGELAGVCSGDPVDTSSFQAASRRLFEGRALAILRPRGTSGTVTLKASAAGLEPASLTVTTR